MNDININSLKEKFELNYECVGLSKSDLQLVSIMSKFLNIEIDTLIEYDIFNSKEVNTKQRLDTLVNHSMVELRNLLNIYIESFNLNK